MPDMYVLASIHARHWAKRYRSLYLKKRSEMSEQQKYVQSAHES